MRCFVEDKEVIFRLTGLFSFLPFLCKYLGSRLHFLEKPVFPPNPPICQKWVCFPNSCAAQQNKCKAPVAGLRSACGIQQGQEIFPPPFVFVLFSCFICACKGKDIFPVLMFLPCLPHAFFLVKVGEKFRVCYWDVYLPLHWFVLGSEC